MTYRHCNQTVTVYRNEGEYYSRKVYDRAFLDLRHNQSIDKTGSKESTGFLLIIPGDTQSVFVGDKVFLGVGREIRTAKEWADFIPARVPGLAVVGYAALQYHRGKPVHTEAGA